MQCSSGEESYRNYAVIPRDVNMVPDDVSSAAVHRFGGDWTSSKLDVLARYLSSYTTALKDKPSSARPFRKAYIDAFAGTGYRAEREDPGGSDSLLFPDLAEDAPQGFLDGSARLALKTTPRFDRYIFIERNHDRCQQLDVLRRNSRILAPDVSVLEGDANVEIQRLCEKDWRFPPSRSFPGSLWHARSSGRRSRRWQLRKQSNLWVLFPLGIGVNRLLTRSGDIPASWRHRLDTLLGTADWYNQFYRIETESTLFATTEERVVKASTTTIGEYLQLAPQERVRRRCTRAEGPAEFHQLPSLPSLLRGWK